MQNKARQFSRIKGQVNVKYHGVGDMMVPWKVLVVDDDPDVQNVTKLVLGDFEYMGRGIMLLQAGSAKEGLVLLRRNPDVAIGLIDVVMEAQNSGLDLVRAIREELGNKMIRIILRTGQPGAAPEKKVVVDYDINDYKEKSELTFQKLQTCIITALRSYHDLQIIESSRVGLEKIIDASAGLFRFQMMKSFAEGLLVQLVSLLELNPDALLGHVSSVAAGSPDMSDYRIYAAMGDYAPYAGGTLDDVQDDELHSDLREAMEQEKNYRNGSRLTLFFKTTTGATTLIHIQGINNLTTMDKKLLEVFCSNISIAFDNLSLKTEIEDTQRDLLLSLGEAIEMRSPKTGEHVMRISGISRLIAEQIGLSEVDAARLALISPMHDVGKITTPDCILNKPGPLADQEWEIMREHAANGARLLERPNRAIFHEAAIVALQHHERFDGKGYPAGLAGDDIHVFARIVSLVDVFDALINKRVYKDAWPLERALSYLRDEKGKQFDPRVVDAFFEKFPEILPMLAGAEYHALPGYVSEKERN